ncbi:MAG: twin-arginine translocase TatA/TatE family subunit [Chloroflexi bacterium]|nr:twin-arginine translocase TatA/TatE family subunit [Chloroflexota bacterium]
MPFNLGAPELIIILVVVLVLFGFGKLRGMGGIMGKEIRSFKTSIKGEEEAGPKVATEPKREDITKAS